MSTSVFEPVRKMLEGEFATAWQSLVTGTPIRYENVTFEQPANAQWVAFYIRWGLASQVSCGTPGTRVERHVGAVVVQVFTPKNTGQNGAMLLCDAVGAALRMKSLYDSANGIQVLLRSPSTSDQGEKDELLQKTVSVEFQVDALF